MIETEENGLNALAAGSAIVSNLIGSSMPSGHAHRLSADYPKASHKVSSSSETRHVHLAPSPVSAHVVFGFGLPT
jgi:hypothetical protein